MQDSITFDDVDRRIIQCLQIAPRAPWALVGTVVGINPATAARRWERLFDAGAAWIACYPLPSSPSQGSLIELDCEPGRSLGVAMELAADSPTLAVNIKSGEHDVLAEVITGSSRHQASYSLERVAAIPGIRSIKTLPIAKVFAEGNQWQLRVLAPAAVRALRAGTRSVGVPAQVSEGAESLSDRDWEVLLHIQREPRISFRELAEFLDVSAATAHRRFASLQSRLRFRCEVARTRSGWPVYATFFVSCPANRLDATAKALARLPEVRLVTAVLGSHNLYLGLWLRSVEHMQAFESQLAAKLPEIVIADRSMVLRPIKQLGHLLDQDGLRIGSVPIDLREMPAVNR